jgi:hypothetical protein
MPAASDPAGALPGLDPSDERAYGGTSSGRPLWTAGGPAWRERLAELERVQLDVDDCQYADDLARAPALRSLSAIKAELTKCRV